MSDPPAQPPQPPMQPPLQPQQPPAAPNDRSTVYGIIGIVGAVCCPLLGILFGILALLESRKFHSSPTLAYLAIGLSALSIILNSVLIAGGNHPYTGFYNR